MAEGGKGISRRTLIKGAVLAGLGGTAWYQLGTRDRLEVRRETLRLPKWKADGFRVAFLSDFHVRTRFHVEPALLAVNLAVHERPDVMLFGGDYFNHIDSLPHFESFLRQIDTAGIPTYAILGNHDYGTKDVGAVIDRIRGTDVRLLRNELVDIDGVTIYGIDDGLFGKDRHDRLRESHESGSVLAVFHEPDFVDRIDPRVSLMLAGHSHGGQVCLPMGKPLNLPRGARKYWDGFYPKAEVPLYVSRGVGMTGPQVRTFCRPDISILTLRGAA